VTNTPKTKVVYPVVGDNIIIHSGLINEKTLWCIDIIADSYIKNKYEGRVPGRHKDDKVLQHTSSINKYYAENLLNGLGNAESFSINDKSIFTNYPWTRKYYFKQLVRFFSTLNDIKISCKFKVKYFFDATRPNNQLKIIKHGKNKGARVTSYYDYMELNIENTSLFKIEEYTNNKIMISFRNPFCYSFATNCTCLHYQYMPFEFYDLSKYSQFLYRRILPKGYNKYHEHSLEEIASWLNLKNSNKTEIKKKIGGCLSELSDNSFIDYNMDDSKKTTYYKIAKHKISNFSFDNLY
jgi:hypothetical protein